jgi:hypothetical protein
MEYYKCPIEDLYREIRRRGGYIPHGNGDELSEALEEDDKRRDSDATTVKTIGISQFVPRDVNLARTAEFGESFVASRLVNEKIVYWTMNTFFPTLQLFFESGRSCTIDGSGLPDAAIGLDPELRFKLTDCSHEEDGRITQSTLPERFASSGTGLVVREVLIAHRTSIALKVLPGSPASPESSITRITTEIHTVVGLRLKGMSSMAFVWAKAPGEKTWGNVRIAGLRNDVPVPSFLGQTTKLGSQTTVVVKESLIRKDTEKDVNGDWPTE